MNTIRILLLAALAAFVALGSGCSQRGPAEQAIEAAEQSLGEISEAAQKYVPQQYAAVKAQLDAARKALAEEKFDEALATAKALPAQAQEVGAAAAAARDALAAQLKVDWEGLVGSLPGRIDALEQKVSELEAARKLPAGIERSWVEVARKGIPVAQQAWSEAQDALAGSNLEGAVARAQEAERLVNELMKIIGMEQPAAAPAS